mmetsp:Transcript_992/g.3132  ORF Transcript_992/g.3132 Transcript_992/m.3132 type:complete len:938 (-) Transcript_992:110-2923(-)
MKEELGYTAFHVNRICEVHDDTITSIATWSDMMYMGTQKGRVIVYTLNPDFQSESPDAVCGCFEEAAVEVDGSEEVKKIDIVESLGTLLVVCGSRVEVRDLASLEELYRVDGRFSDVCTADVSGCHYLLAASNESVTVFKHEEGYTRDRDIKTEDTVCSICSHGSMLYVATTAAFWLYSLGDSAGHVVSHVPLEASPTCWTPRIHLRKDECGDAQIYLSCPRKSWKCDAKVTQLSVIMEWEEPADEIIVCHQYLLLRRGNNIEAYNVRLKSMLSTPVQRFSNVSSTQGTCCVDNRRVFSASHTSVFCLAMSTREHQVRQVLHISDVDHQLLVSCAARLAEERQEEEASSVPPSISTRMWLNEEVAYSLLHLLRFKESVPFFKRAIRMQVDGRDVFSLFDPCDLLSYLEPSRSIRQEAKERLWERMKHAMPRGDGGDKEGKTMLDLLILSRLRSSNALLSDEEEEVWVEEHKEEFRQTLSSIFQFARSFVIRNLIRHVDIVKLDNYLVKLLASTDPSKLVSLLQSEHFANLGECQEVLLSCGRHHAIAMLHARGGEERMALEIWKKLGEGSLREAGRDGVSETVEHLKRCQDFSLIQEFSKWVIEVRPKAALHVFVSHDRKDSFNSTRVADFLQQQNEQVYIDFLEHEVMDASSESCDLRTRLARIYLDGMRGGSSELSREDTRRRLLHLLRDGRELDEKILLQNDSLPLFEERVLLYGRSALKLVDASPPPLETFTYHRKALEIIVWCLRDMTAAEAYCVNKNMWMLNASPHEDIPSTYSNKLFLLLLNVLLSPIGSEEAAAAAPLVEDAKRIWRRYGRNLQEKDVMHALPEGLALTDMLDVVGDMMRRSWHEKCHLQIERSLWKLRHLQVKNELVDAKSDFIVVDDTSICTHTGAKLGTQAFLVLPDRSLVLYHVAEKLRRETTAPSSPPLPWLHT